MTQPFRPGTFESVFPRPTLSESFTDLRKAGFSSVQFDFSSVETDVWSGPIDSSVVNRVASVGKETGVSIPAIAGTFNMAHPDPAVRAAGLAGIQRVLEAASILAAPYVTLCTGSRSMTSMWHAHEDNASAEAWRDSRASIEAALESADRHGVILLVEPEPANVVGSANMARRMLDEIGHPRLKIVLDPANVVLSDLSRPPSEVLAEAFEVLGPDIAFAHAKDLSADGEFCAAGTGIVPWPYYRSLLADIDYTGDVIFHTLSEADVPRALAVWLSE